MRSPLGSRIPLASLIQALAVAEHLNFRHAANALGVSQSSVIAAELAKMFRCFSVAACAPLARRAVVRVDERLRPE